MNDNQSHDDVRTMLSIKQVLAKVPFSRATIYREMEAGRFPKAKQITPHRIAWFEEDILAWQDAIEDKDAA